MNLQQHMDQWIAHLSSPQEKLGNMSVCPFAKSAKYQLIHANFDSIEIPKKDFELIIFVLPEEVSETDMLNHCKDLNEKHIEYIFLPDPMNRETFINGVQTNNNKFNLVLCQPKDKLLKARQSLLGTKYYTYWSSDYLKEITGMEL
jgi:hypothetical protein